MIHYVKSAPKKNSDQEQNPLGIMTRSYSFGGLNFLNDNKPHFSNNDIPAYQYSYMTYNPYPYYLTVLMQNNGYSNSNYSRGGIN